MTNFPPKRVAKTISSRLFAAASMMSISITTPFAYGETLQDALQLAYNSNPTIKAERAQLRASDELKAQALAALLPQISGQGSFLNAEISQTSTAGGPFDQQGVPLDQLSASANGDLLLFDGFSSIHAVRQAASQIHAAEAQLISVEQNLLNQVATAYFDVVRDMEVFSFNSANVDVLFKQLEQAQVRFRVGEITKTDVAQAEARLAGARSNLTNASTQLAVSRAVYVQLVGQSPGTLETNLPSPTLPATLDEAVSLAREIAPSILIARSTEEASQRGIRVARGRFAPTITATANYQFAEEPSTFISESETFAYGARINVPIFQGGNRFSQVRQAKAVNDRDRQRIYEAERLVQAQVVSAWEQLTAAKANIVSAQTQVEANNLALQGVKKEALFGSRSTLDVLNAELEALNSQVGLATAKRNANVATYSLLASIGMFTPESVGIVDNVELKRGGIRLPDRFPKFP